jgi:hypothetical protein
VTAAAESENVGRKRSAPMAYDYLNDLNREQRRAVKHGVSDGSALGGNPLLVIACRVAQLVSENSSVSETLPMILQLSST